MEHNIRVLELWVNLDPGLGGGHVHPSLEMVVSTRVRVHGSGQHFPQFDSKASRPLPVASDFEWPFLRKIAKLWLLSSFLN